MDDSGFYTGKGDRGDTGRLMSAGRVSKDSALIEAVGALDEATSAIGVARARCPVVQLQERLAAVQHHLYRLMAHLSAVPEARQQYPGLRQAEVDWLEQLIAQLEADLPSLKDFVLPGDAEDSAALHVARAVVRRAERRLVALSELEPNVDQSNLAYINRLSSLMFVAALYVDQSAGRSPSLAKQQYDI